MGQRFAREHMKGSTEHENYHQCGTREEKKTFRENWAKKRFQDYTVGKEFDKSFSSIDTTLGEYMTFGATVIKYGGWTWSPAVTGALSTAAKCTALGGKWISIDEFSGLPMFFVLQRQHAEIFAKKWSEFEKHRTETRGTPKVAPNDKDKQDEATTPEPKAKAKAKAKAKGKGAAAVEPPSASKKGVPKAKAKAALHSCLDGLTEKDLEKRSLQVKTQLQKAKMAAVTLVQHVQNRPEYARFNNDSNVGVLGKAIDAMEKSVTSFGTELFFQDLKFLKIKYGHDYCKSLKDFVQAVEPHLENVIKETRLMIDLQKTVVAAAVKQDDGEVA